MLQRIALRETTIVRDGMQWRHASSGLSLDSCKPELWFAEMLGGLAGPNIRFVDRASSADLCHSLWRAVVGRKSAIRADSSRCSACADNVLSGANWRVAKVGKKPESSYVYRPHHPRSLKVLMARALHGMNLPEVPLQETRRRRSCGRSRRKAGVANPVAARIVAIAASALHLTSVGPSVAMAQTDAEQASTMADEAAMAYANGDLTGAIALYEEAFALIQDPNIAYNLGAMHDEAGNTADAYNYFALYVELFPGAEDRAQIETYLDELLVEVQRNFTLVAASSRPDGARVFRLNEDGTEDFLGVTLIEMWVEPGSIDLSFRLDGYQVAEERLRGVAGVRVSATPRLEEASAVVVVDDPEGNGTGTGNGETGNGNNANGNGTDDLGTDSGSGSPVPVILLAGGGVLVGTGVALFAVAQGKQNERDDLVASIRAGDDVSGPVEDLESQMSSLRLGGTIALAAGVAAVGTGVVLLLTGGDSDDDEPMVGFSPITPDSWGFVFSGSF